MAKQDADRLLNDLDSNKELYAKIQKASKKVLDVAKAHGYDVSENDIRQAMNDKMGTSIPMMKNPGGGQPGGGQPGGGGGQPGDPGDPGDPGADPMTCFIASEAPGY